ncbi:unnamed protein product, partial [Symbiodinium microadriaticum]
VPAMARQLADELAIPRGDWQEEALYCLLQEAQQEAKVHRRVRGYLHNDLTWMTLMLMPPMELPTKEGAGRGPRYVPDSPPPKGERNRKLIEDGCIVAAREERLLDIWSRKLQEASTRTALRCYWTLKRYLSYYRQWRLWLGESEAKLRYPPWRPADLVDFLLARQDEPCGRTVPEAILKAIFWVERVAEFPEEQRATHGRLAWAAKDKITELVLDQGHAIGWRVWAWAKLVIRPLGHDAKTHEDLGISEHAFFLKRAWLKEGFSLLKQHAGYKRDYLMPRLNADGGLEQKPAGYADAMVATAGLLGILGPARAEGLLDRA